MQENLSVLSKLQEHTDPSKFLHHHESVKLNYSGAYAKKENLLQFGRGYIYTQKELSEFAAQNKKPMQLKFQKDSWRAFAGSMIQNPPKITFSATEPSDDAIVDPLKTRLAWESHILELNKKDRATIKDAWLTGSGYQEIYTFIKDGDKKPTIGVSNENVLAIYWDPTSTQLGRREDANFVDRVKFLSLEDIENGFEDLAAEGEFEGLQSMLSESYVPVINYADRGHETVETRNGTFKVVERFYRVTKKEHIAHEQGGKVKLEIQKPQDLQAYKASNPGVYVQKMDTEYIYLAIACPAWKKDKFLYNGPLHCQIRNPRNGKILWPIIELVCEGEYGEATGFAEDMQDAVKSANGLISQIYHSARTNSGSGTLFKPDYFKDPKDAKEYEKFGSDPTRHFRLKNEAPADTVTPIPKGTISQEHTQLLDIFLQYIEKVSSTPPAMKGQMESAGTSGKLNEQRINQSFIQLQQPQANYADFKKRVAEYLLGIWVEYNDAYINENVRLLTKNNADDPDFITFNQLTEEKDEQGNLTGRLKKLNDVSTILYDVQIEDPYNSPVARQIEVDTLMDLMNTPALQQADPGMVGEILQQVLALSGIPMEAKLKLQQASTIYKNKVAEKQAAEQAQQQTDMAATQAQTQGQHIANQGQAQANAQQAQMGSPPEQAPRMAA